MSDTKQVAKDYIYDGWSVVPVVKGEKKATTSWQRKKYGPQDFRADDNIAGKCGEPSGWRVDVDCDAIEAVQAAKMLLPVTGLIHGRKGKPDSHHWFIAEGLDKIVQFTDVKDANGKTNMLVEIRSNGGYTMLPPSTWTDKDDPTHQEQLVWSSEGTPTIIDPATLYDHVRNVAITTLVARHWPGHGVRHGMVGHLTGFLLQAGIEKDTVVKMVKAAATIANDSDVDDRVKYCLNTIAKFENGENVTGGPKLSEALGADVVARMRAWLKLADVGAIEEMNGRHFFVRMGKDSVIGREDDPDQIVFQKPRELHTEYKNRSVQVGTDKNGEPQFKPLFEEWLGHPTRRSYSKVVFDPPPHQARSDEYNLWKGFSVVESREAFLAGKCLHILNHIRDIICDGDPERTAYLLNLMALTVQQPGEPLGICVIMRGEQGSGKGVFVEYLGSLFHKHHYSHITNMDQAIGRFNKAILGKIIIFLDEAAAAAAQRNHGTFKSLITDKTFQIELKGVDTDEVRNLSHVFAATNDEQSIPTSEGDRRGFYLLVSNKYAYQRCSPATRKAYFDALFQEMNSADGKAALLYFLQQRDLSKFDRFDKVITEEELKQRKQNLKGAMRWLYDVVELGQIPTGATKNVHVTSLYELYAQWAQRHGETPIGHGPWGKVVAQYLYVGGASRVTKHAGDDVRVVDLNSIDDLRKALPPLETFTGPVIHVYRKTPAGMVEETHSPATGATATRPLDEDIPF